MQEVERRLLEKMFTAAVHAATPAVCLPPNLPNPPRKKTYVIGAGKAAAAMAKTLEECWNKPLDGLVVTRYGHGASTNKIKVSEANHPIPDQAGINATTEILRIAKKLTKDDLAICLISGGGSSLLTLPAPGISLDDKRSITNALLRSGANIYDINCVRSHLSAIKAGRLALACYPAPVLTLAISDVTGNDPSVIASGPTVADPTTQLDAKKILQKYDICVPQNIYDHLNTSSNETPTNANKQLLNSKIRIIAKPMASLEAAAKIAHKAGYKCHILSDSYEGEASTLAATHAAMVKNYSAGTILLSGGEATVVVKGSGKGGPNTEFALSLAQNLSGHPKVWALACDTDGIDGTEDNAGAIISPDTLMRAKSAGQDVAKRLANNDSYPFFAALGDLIISGPTLTNVNDFRAILISH